MTDPNEEIDWRAIKERHERRKRFWNAVPGALILVYVGYLFGRHGLWSTGIALAVVVGLPMVFFGVLYLSERHPGFGRMVTGIMFLGVVGLFGFMTWQTNDWIHRLEFGVPLLVVLYAAIRYLMGNSRSKDPT